MKPLLADKVIVITGGTRGLGRSLAIAAAGEGASVVIGGLEQAEGREVIRAVRARGGKGLFVRGDLGRVSECRRLIAKAKAAFGRIDGLVNYAGILPVCPLTDTDEKLFDRVFGLNIKAPYFCTQYAVRSMMATGGGAIINIGSLHAYNGEADRAAYACSKGALLTLTHHVAKNYARNKIRANWITMGWVATPGELALRRKQGRGQAWLDKVAARVMPMQRLQTPEDYVPGMLYLLSDAANQVTGTELFVTGGFFL